jgi:pyruvate ferredoxin oxidoreductase beta subunit
MTTESASGPVRFLQVGSLAAGNRLVDLSLRAVQADPNRPSGLTKGHRACRGCGEALAARVVLDAASRGSGGRLVTVNATGCLEVFTSPYPESAWKVPWLHSLFGNAPAVASGVAAALAATGRDDVRVLAQGGDGGTLDIGFGTLSGMFERNDDVLYVCYDNQAYMNTGVQRSGATPPAARTATTPVVHGHGGKDMRPAKDAPRIAMAHGIPYVATATVADLRDLEAKVTRAMGLHGARYLHVLVPCPLGWGSATDEAVRLARLATQTGLFPLFEAVDGEVVATTPIRHREPVEAYLRPQKRFAHLFAPERDEEALAAIQAGADRTVGRYRLDRAEDDPDDDEDLPVEDLTDAAGGGLP